ncbi:MAG TPA: 4'-phosphopantetheinyl transferase superfamily protein [Rhodocyclaceae bacterium]|nr:4'-phosphopantetheinyl transferase superfamily protein [Rhodocyclaceae bacterium]
MRFAYCTLQLLPNTMLKALTPLNLPPDVPDTVEVWLLDIDAATPRLPATLALLGVDEHVRYQRYHHPADAQRFALTRAALRQLLAAKLGREATSLHFSHGFHGKPALSDSTLHFNVSHSGQYGLIAISTTHSVGIDIERHADKPPLEVLASPIFTQAERDYCANDSARFYALWCGKEAMIKVCGTGFSMDRDLPSTLPPGNDNYTVQQGTKVWSLSVARHYTGALAVPHCSATLRT